MKFYDYYWRNGWTAALDKIWWDLVKFGKGNNNIPPTAPWFTGIHLVIESIHYSTVIMRYYVHHHTAYSRLGLAAQLVEHRSYKPRVEGRGFESYPWSSRVFLCLSYGGSFTWSSANIYLSMHYIWIPWSTFCYVFKPLNSKKTGTISRYTWPVA